MIAVLASSWLHNIGVRVFQPCEPRPLDFLGVETVSGFRLKVYAIRFGGAEFDKDSFSGGWALARAALPQPAIVEGRPGLGFAILHQGRTADYFVLGWWDQENELPLRVFVRDSNGWRPAANSESVCVWDLRVIWHEREAYVRTMLAGSPGDEAAYLAATIHGEA
jgi:hypothetical protein